MGQDPNAVSRRRLTRNAGDQLGIMVGDEAREDGKSSSSAHSRQQPDRRRIAHRDRGFEVIDLEPLSIMRPDMLSTSADQGMRSDLGNARGATMRLSIAP